MAATTVESRARQGRFGRQYSDSDLLSKLRECAEATGTTPGIKTFDGWSEQNLSQILMLRFRSWRAACEAAGLEPNDRPVSPAVGRRKYSDDVVGAAYARIRTLTGGPPTLSEWRKCKVAGEPGAEVLRRRYGNGWVPFLEAMEAGLQPSPRNG